MVEKTYIVNGGEKLDKYINENLPLCIGVPGTVGTLESKHLLKIEGNEQGIPKVLDIIGNLTKANFTEII